MDDFKAMDFFQDGSPPYKESFIAKDLAVLHHIGHPADLDEPDLHHLDEIVKAPHDAGPDDHEGASIGSPVVSECLHDLLDDEDRAQSNDARDEPSTHDHHGEPVNEDKPRTPPKAFQSLSHETQRRMSELCLGLGQHENEPRTDGDPVPQQLKQVPPFERVGHVEDIVSAEGKEVNDYEAWKCGDFD